MEGCQACLLVKEQQVVPEQYADCRYEMRPLGSPDVISRPSVFCMQSDAVVHVFSAQARPDMMPLMQGWN